MANVYPMGTAVIDVCPRPNLEMVTNNLTAVIEVALVDHALSEALLFYMSPYLVVYPEWPHR